MKLWYRHTHSIVQLRNNRRVALAAAAVRSRAEVHVDKPRSLQGDPKDGLLYLKICDDHQLQAISCHL